MRRLHDMDVSPKFGITQVTLGTRLSLAFEGVTRRTPINEALLEARQVLALNLRRLLRQKYPTATDLPREFEKDFGPAFGVKKSTVSRILDWNSDPYHYPKFDSLIRIAYALKRQVYELFVLAPDLRESAEPPSQDSLRRNRDLGRDGR